MPQSLSISQLESSVTKRQLEPVYLALGREALLIDEVIRIGREQIVADSTRDFNLDVIHADDSDLESLSAALNALPMMTEKRVVILKKVESASQKIYNYLKSYMEHPSPDTVLFICFEGDAKSAWVKNILAKVIRIDCDILSKKELSVWIKSFAADRGVTIHQDAIAMMLEEREVRLVDLAGELEKASLLAGNNGTITLEILQQVWGIESEINIWTFFDRASSGRRTQALSDFQRLRSDFDKDKNSGFIISQIVKRLRLAWRERSYDQMHIPTANRISNAQSDMTWRLASSDLKTLAKTVAERSLGRLRNLDRTRKTKSVQASTLFERELHRISLDRKNIKK